MGDDLDSEMLEYVRKAIRKAGGVPVVSERTGIPKKTLEKYLSKRSMPSLLNAAKIAEAAGMGLSEVATGKPSKATDPLEVAVFTVALMKDIHEVVGRIHREEGVALQPAVLVEEVARHTSELMGKLDHIGDIDEARALFPWLENRIRKELREAAAAPGTGKREAS